MWWNFMGRTHEEIVEYRRKWQAELASGFDGSVPDRRFGVVPGYDGPALPAPELPNSTLPAPRLVVALAATGRERRFDQACSMSW